MLLLEDEGAATETAGTLILELLAQAQEPLVENITKPLRHPQ